MAVTTTALEKRHPGQFIREQVLPKGTSVTQAAALLGVGRPALSNLLNGRASLSADMANRIASAYGQNREELLRLQAEYDAWKSGLETSPAETRTYVPPFLGITAAQVGEWADRHLTRSRLAVFLRTLVNSTGRGLTKVDFPGNDDSERPGWDGYTEANHGTPWVPAGKSGWEFGTNKNVKGKAEGDFDKNVQALDHKERSATTFIFVTPRKWPGKNAWVKEKLSLDQWRDVRAYDSSDIEQWLEQSLPGQAWFSSETRLPKDVRSLDKCWSDWAEAANPTLIGALFRSAVEASRQAIVSRLSRPPDGKPIYVGADSTDEALAFISQLFAEDGNELETHRDRVIVFDKPGVLPGLAYKEPRFIAVVHSREVEHELGPYVKSLHSIILYPRNAIPTPDVVLEPLDHQSFEDGLKTMGLSRDDTARLANESGRSLTVLRRRLATVASLQRPAWSNPPSAARLVPLMLAGAWRSDTEADTHAVSLLADRSEYTEVESTIRELVAVDDAPVWSIGTCRGVISKMDLLHAISGVVTKHDLDRYFEVAEAALGEEDPALDLPEDKRWAAPVFGKSRQYSSLFRESICETLVLLAVYGEPLFQRHLGVAPATTVANLVRKLLPEPLSTRTLEAHDRNLPTYAEAAPDVFLSLVERDLLTASPAVKGLLRPAGQSFFGHPTRTGLLWALERLLWNPDTFTRAARVLAELAKVEIADNWVNKPQHSLENAFSAWMPQTAASHEERVSVLKLLATRFPEVAWRVCVKQLDIGMQIGNYNNKPKWRSDGHGHGEPLRTLEPILAFQREMLALALNWCEGYALKNLEDLVERLSALETDDQARVLSLIVDWAPNATDEDRAALHEKLRRSMLSVRALRRHKRAGTTPATVAEARKALAALVPSNLFNRHAWLFKEPWVEETGDELEDASRDYEKRDARVQELRVSAMLEVVNEHGIVGLLHLALQGNASVMLGELACSRLLNDGQIFELLEKGLDAVLNETSATARIRAQSLIAGVLRSASQDLRRRIVLNVTQQRSDRALIELLVLAPFDKEIWSIVGDFAQTTQEGYWKRVVPNQHLTSLDELRFAVDQLLSAKRPRAAFWCAQFHFDDLDGVVIYGILSCVAKGGEDPPGEYLLEEYYLEGAFKRVHETRELDLEQKAILELPFIGKLRQSTHGIPNIERYVELNPEWFVHALVWTFRRSDKGEDPPELRLPDDRRESMARLGYELLTSLRRIPGHNDVDELSTKNLSQWTLAVRSASENLSRLKVCDIRLGELFSHAPTGPDGIWPCEPVRDVLEELRSDEIMEGAVIGVRNSRGLHWKQEGGDQERELARRYRTWADATRTSHPFVSSALLRTVAESYEQEGKQEDASASVRRRVGHW